MSSVLRSRRILLIAGIAVFLLLFAISVAAMQWIQPQFIRGALRPEGREEWKAFSAVPWEAPAEFGALEIEITLRRRTPAATRFALRADDCLEHVSVNGEVPALSAVPPCRPGREQVLDLTGFLRPGENILRFKVRNRGGEAGLALRVSDGDPLLLALRACSLALIAGFGVFLALVLRRALRAWSGTLIGVVVLGVILRMTYFYVTPFTLRAHDALAHAQYVRFVLEQGLIPFSDGGWEFFQPPLYYALAAGWWKLLALAHADGRIFPALQFLSLLFSLASFLFAYLAARRIFPSAADRIPLIVSCTALATLPGLVFSASRIGNDVPAQAWAFLAMYLLVRWWQDGRDADWIALAAAAGFGLLTKSSAILVIGAAALCLFLKPGVPLRRALRLACVVILVIAIIAGWYAALRFAQGDRSLLPNAAGLNATLRVPTTRTSFTVFNPIRLIQVPFNDPWHGVGGGHFWEYYFRSAFFGEFRHAPALRPLASVIIALALLLIPFLFFSIFRALREWRRFAPLLCILAVPLAGQAAIRVLYPFSVLQDFRHTAMVALPAACLLALGIARSHPFLRRAGIVCCVLLAACFTLFLVALGFAPS